MDTLTKAFATMNINLIDFIDAYRPYYNNIKNAKNDVELEIELFDRLITFCFTHNLEFDDFCYIDNALQVLFGVKI